MHVTSLFGLVFPASYDEYIALVKIGDVASGRVKRAVIIGMYLWWNLDTVTY